MRIFQNVNINFLAKRKIFYMVSSSLILLGIISFIIRGLEFGIDFQGGTEIGLSFQKPVDISEVRNQINSIGLGQVEVKTFGGSKGVLVRTELQVIPKNLFPKIESNIKSSINSILPNIEFMTIEKTENSVTFKFQNADTAKVISEKLLENGYQTTYTNDEQFGKNVVVRVGISDWIKENIKGKFSDNSFIVLKEEQVGPKIGEELKSDAAIAIILAIISIMIYMTFRFKFIFSIGAGLALFHDVLITLGLFSLLYGVLDYLNLEISINVVAAFLTLIGFSINDTVIVFDRIRENMKIHKTASIEFNINHAINQTLPRTVITSLTVWSVTVILFFLGGDVLRGFAFTLFIGIIVGTYSSIYVASAIIYDYSLKTKKKIEF